MARKSKEKDDGYFGAMLAETKNEYASVVKDGIVGDIKSYIDTGNYALNALLSGSLYGGIPNNKIITFAGDPSTGKTWFVLGIVKNYLEQFKNAGVFFFESEGALTSSMISSRGIDTKRMFMCPVETIEDFKTQALRIVNKQLEIPEADRRPIMICLDSLGMLSSTKEMEDTASGSDKADMTKARSIKAALRTLTLRCAKAEIPVLITNHVYNAISYIPTKTMGGGMGIVFAAAIVVFLSKSKIKDEDKAVIGTTITCVTNKSRLTREFQRCQVQLIFESGLRKYSGLLELGEKYGVIKKDGHGWLFPSGVKVKLKDLEESPDVYFTDEVLAALEPCAIAEYCYGTGAPSDETEEVENE